jgi:uncharacterized protein
MNLSGFTFIVTEDCNFNCSYCYQKKAKKYMDLSLVKKAVDYFSPFFDDGCHVSFYGGEPLLAFELIKGTVDYILRKKLNNKIRFALTTNGILVNNEMLEFFNRHKFSLLLSFDGPAQDLCRGKGSFTKVFSVLKKILAYPDLDIDTNSVFTPETVHLLSESVEFIVGLGIKQAQLSISTISKWDRDSIIKLATELGKIKKFLVSFYKKNGFIPVDIFAGQPRKGIFGCNGGMSRMTVAADGKLWGCYLFSDYFKGKEGTKGYHKYCFGDSDYFISNQKKFYSRILANYRKLRMDYFCTPEKFCTMCDELEECHICPVDAALSGAVIGNIPDHLCRVNRVLRKVGEELRQELESESGK